MAKKHISSKPGLSGYVYHYDKNGKRIGKSRSNLLGVGKVYYDARGRKVGTSRPGVFAKEIYHDKEGEQYISSYEGIAGDLHILNGNPVGVTRSGFGNMRYTKLEVEDNQSEGFFVDDEYLSEYDAQEISGDSGIDRKSVIIYIIVFAACCLFAGILFLFSK